MKKPSLIFIFFSILFSCQKHSGKPVDYPAQVGDIPFDAGIDAPDFKLCDEKIVLQYYMFGKGLLYRGEKAKINEHFMKNFKARYLQDETGFITIRFIVNCHGQTGRFRIQGMDLDFKERTFDEVLINQIVHLTKSLDGWIVGELEGQVYDYYQYLTCKIEHGQLIEITP